MSPILSFIVVLLGIYGLCNNKDIIKSIIYLNIIQTAVILIFLNIGNLDKDSAPIITGVTSKLADPLPQALMITTIVIGAAITALALKLCIKIFHYYGTLSWKEMIEREG